MKEEEIDKAVKGVKKVKKPQDDKPFVVRPLSLHLASGMLSDHVHHFISVCLLVLNVFWFELEHLVGTACCALVPCTVLRRLLSTPFELLMEFLFFPRCTPVEQAPRPPVLVSPYL